MKCFHEQYASAQQTQVKLLNNRNALKDEDKTWKQNGHWSMQLNKKSETRFKIRKMEKVLTYGAGD